MSVSDPLIKELKGWMLKFVQDVKNAENVINDDNSNLQPFCSCLERIFYKGLVFHCNTLGFVKQTDCWDWLQKITALQYVGVTYAYVTCVERVRSMPCLSTNVGRFRLLIRSCLVNRCLHVPLQALERIPQSAIYEPGSILGDEILREILHSVILQCSQLKFNLVLSHAAFLDDTWLLPCYETVELVPCGSLGMSVSFINNKAVVARIQPSSIADDEGKIQIGDILDELNGNPVTSSMKGQLGSIMRKGLGKPIKLRLIKSKMKGSNEFFPPIIALLKNLKIDIEALPHDLNISSNNSGSKNDNQRTVAKEARAGYEVTYVGNIEIGKCGDVKRIEHAIRLLLTSKISIDEANPDKPRIEHVRKKVYFEIQEIGVRIVEAETGDLMLSHSYMEISSCGSAHRMPKYFAFISGDKYCNVSKLFTCYVFNCNCDETVQFILQSIGQGFQRTHYAV